MGACLRLAGLIVQVEHYQQEEDLLDERVNPFDANFSIQREEESA
ncbi:hypothetical protein [Pseudomonas citronellolis]|nr:hypothetical protein [Pseudomonas citronellolis]UXJ50299.1 hypothetical protein N5P21_20150 [Pseudomonas citronellolis]